MDPHCRKGRYHLLVKCQFVSHDSHVTLDKKQTFLSLGYFHIYKESIFCSSKRSVEENRKCHSCKGKAFSVSRYKNCECWRAASHPVSAFISSHPMKDNCQHVLFLPRLEPTVSKRTGFLYVLAWGKKII